MIMDVRVASLAMAVLACCCFTPSTQQGISNCVGQLDLVFMVDASNSVLDRNFRSQMDSLRLLTNRLDVRQDAIRIGTIVFSSTVDSAPLSGNKNVVLNGISRFQYLDESTRTDLGLLEAMRLFREIPRNSSVPKLLMVITDGESSMPQRTLTAARQAKAQGITIFAVGITDAVNRNELNALASSPSKVMLTPDFNNIQQVLLDAVRQACTLIVPPTPTQHICANSGSMQTGIGFVSHPMSCDKYIQCYYNPATRFHLGVVRNCPTGLFYNSVTKDCDWPEMVNCRNDPCLKGCMPYPATNSFRAYWKCEKGVSKAECCGKWQTFVPGKGCVNDTWCMEPCKLGPCMKGQCLKRPVWEQMTAFNFKKDLTAASWMPGFCKFNALDMVTCDCTYNTDHACSADFSTTFNTGVIDSQYLLSSGLSFNGNNGATIGNSGRMHLNLHKTMGNEPVSIRMSFSDNVPAGRDGQILLSSSSNCNRGLSGGVLMVIYTRDYIKAKLMSMDKQVVYASVPLTGVNTVNTIKEMVLSYDDRYLALSVKVGDFQAVEKVKAPKGVQFPCGLDIGPTELRPGYTGTIQQLSFYSCTFSRLY